VVQQKQDDAKRRAPSAEDVLLEENARLLAELTDVREKLRDTEAKLAETHSTLLWNAHQAEQRIFRMKQEQR
jgi:hypothetical protein